MKLIINDNVYELVRTDARSFIINLENPYEDFDQIPQGITHYTDASLQFKKYHYPSIKINGEYYGYKLLA